MATGAHVNAVGAITLDRAEFDPALLGRCDVVACDSVSQSRALSRELREHYGTDEAAWEPVRSLAELVAERYVRPQHADLTLFKAMGTGVADVALGVACSERAAAAGLGRLLDEPRRVPPVLRSERVTERSTS